EHNIDFHPMVDFIEASLLRPVTESSLRRNLKLKDEEGISSLPDTELFENLTLMGYNISPNQKFTFQKGQFSHQWKYLIHTMMQCLSPKSTGFNEFSSNISIALVCLATNRTYNFSKMIFDGLVKNVNKISKFLMYPSPSFSGRIVPLFDTMLVQQGEGSDELDSPLRDVSQGEACPTHSGFIADQDRETIAKSFTLPYDSAPRVTSPAADESSMQQTIFELTALCTSLQRQLSELTAKFQAQEVEINRLKERVKLLEDREGVATTRSGDDAPIKGRSMDEREATTEKISDDSEEIATVLTSMDAATVLASEVVNVPTGSGSIPTAIMVEFETPKKQRVQEQIDTQVARELEEKLEREDQRRNNETIAKYLQEYHQFASELPMERRVKLINDLVKYQDNYAKVKDFKGMTFEEVEAKFNSVWKQMEDFIPMGSKEEAERIKRKGISFEQEREKKHKISEEVPEEVKSHDEVPEEKVKEMSHDEVPEEKVKEMMQLVPIEEVYVEALQVKHPIIDWKHLDREDLNQLWRLVKETLSNKPPTSDKEMELWVELSRLYEPDHEDQLWTHIQNFMHSLVEWKLYDSCGVHHVTSKEKEIFMLVEKDYPLRKGLALVMISYKLQVENYSQMANDLILKIYKISNSPRQQGD
nr:synaptobrevin, longin-like domain protein [Tanacetum cinerariifolium]